jgi:hypothetical protein
MISPSPKDEFKIHPIFISSEGEILDYVLFSAYEGSIYRTSSGQYDGDNSNMNFNQDKLSSVGFIKPVGGGMPTPRTAEKLANNRGNGWHITNLFFESALQMLGLIEYGTLNG